MTGGHAGSALNRALLADAAAVGCAARIISATMRDWASATFVGAQHWIDLTVAGDGVPAWLARLPDTELAMRGHIVGDLIVDDRTMADDGWRVAIAALTLRDAR